MNSGKEEQSTAMYMYVVGVHLHTTPYPPPPPIQSFQCSTGLGGGLSVLLSLLIVVLVP